MVVKDFPSFSSIHKVHSKEEQSFQKSSLKTLGGKVKSDRSIYGCWYLVTRLKLTSWRELGVCKEGEKDQMGHVQLLRFGPNTSQACAGIPSFELRRLWLLHFSIG